MENKVTKNCKNSVRENMRVLVTNDDGIESEGLQYLYNYCSSRFKTYVVSSTAENSGKSHSITLYNPIFFKKIDNNKYVVDGTPIDCVKIALSEIFPDVEMVISGINLGLNIGPNIFYSSTVSQAVEAYLYGKNAIALSLQNKGIPVYSTAIKVLDKLINYILNSRLTDFCLSVNIPNIEYDLLKGVKVTAHAVPIIKDNFAKGVSPKGLKYCWVKNDPVLDKKRMKLLVNYNKWDMDIFAVQDGYVSITPLKPVMFDTQLAERLQDLKI